MSLYVHPSITPPNIKAAREPATTGVKSYPAGVTTNSASAIVNYELLYPVFAAMESENMILNLHGESPPGEEVTISMQRSASSPPYLSCTGNLRS